jgi:hypothetical protein
VPPDAGLDVLAWGKARTANAASGAKELVRMPLHRHGPGWGCTCPEYYVAFAEYADDATTLFVDPKFSPASTAFAQVPGGQTRIVEGYFTGKTRSVPGEPGIRYDLHGFTVVRSETPTAAEESANLERLSAESSPRVLATGRDAGPDGLVR